MSDQTPFDIIEPLELSCTDLKITCKKEEQWIDITVEDNHNISGGYMTREEAKKLGEYLLRISKFK